MKRLTIIFIALITVSTIIILGCSNKEKGRFYSTKYGFSIIIPEGWNKTNKINIIDVKTIIALESPKQDAFFSVFAQEVLSKNTLEQLNQNISQMLKDTNAINIKKEIIKISNIDTTKITTSLYNNGDLKNVTIYTFLRNKTMFILLFSTTNKDPKQYSSTLKSLIESCWLKN